MIAHEFDRWLKVHAGAFPGLMEWLRKHEGATTAWREVLDDVALEDALAATKAMNRGEHEAPPFGDHARAVRKLARLLSFEAEQSRRRALPVSVCGPRYRCAVCRDTGVVIVVNAYAGRSGQFAIARLMAGLSEIVPEVGVFCTCTAGRGRNPQYDDRRMLLAGATVGEVREWIAADGHKEPITSFGNYSSALEAFNNPDGF